MKWVDPKRPAMKKRTQKRRTAGRPTFSRAKRVNKGDLGPRFPFMADARTERGDRDLRGVIGDHEGEREREEMNDSTRSFLFARYKLWGSYSLN